MRKRKIAGWCLFALGLYIGSATIWAAVIALPRTHSVTWITVSIMGIVAIALFWGWRKLICQSRKKEKEEAKIKKES